MRSYRKAAIWAVVSTYFLIFIGGLVRVSGAGLGCPDWPKCFGRWIPPLNAAQLPPGFDPASFNFVLAWIEYFNRLVGVFVGLAILATAILALIYFKKNMAVLLPSLCAAVLVAYQGWQGSRVVSSTLEPIIVTVHMLLALLIVSLLIFAALQAFFADRGGLKTGVFPSAIPKLLLTAWGVSIIAVLLGSQVRQAIETAIKEFPLLFKSDLIQQIGIIDDLHMFFGLVTALVTFYAMWLILKKSHAVSMLIRQAAWAAAVLAVLQIAIGFVMLMIGPVDLIQLLHLWLASLLVGLLLLLYVFIRKGGESVHE